MTSEDTEQARAFWDRTAADWQRQVGDQGDLNRRMNSDPVLWEFAGDVSGLDVLDAGCGTGYLSRQLQQRGATVTGVDFSEEMIRIARSKSDDIDFRVADCGELQTLNDAAFDLIVSNYVLMDTPNLEGTVEAFHRVLRPGGAAVLIFSHPCFPQARMTSTEDYQEVSYYWSFRYFDRTKCVDPPWGHFTSEFIWFHRPLSDYWKAFQQAGFQVENFDEPHITPERYHLAPTEQKLKSSQTRPFSVAFQLRKPSLDECQNSTDNP